MTTKNCSSRRVRRRISKVVEKERFETLPDELILQIMETTKDVKTLTRCMAVSKRFSSLARMARFVSLSIQRPMLGVQCYKLTPDPLTYAHLQNTPSEDRLFVTGESKPAPVRPFCMYWPRHPLNQNPENLAHLNCFKEIRNLSIRFMRGDVPYRCNDVVNWKLETSKDYPLGFKSCVILERVRADESGSGISKHRFRSDWVRRRVKWLGALIRLLLDMNPVFGRVMRDHPTVKSVTLGDVKGEIHGGEDLRGGSDQVGPKKVHLSMRTWFVPMIELLEPVRLAVEGPNQTGIGVMVTVVRPNDLVECHSCVDLVRSGFGYGGFGPEIAEKIASSPLANIMELSLCVMMGHTSEHD